MSYIYSQALVAEYLADNYSDIDASAQLNESHTPKLSWWHDKTMEPSRHSRFGMTYAPLTERLGMALSTWFVGVSLAKTLAQQAKAPELTESVQVCGVKWPGSLAKYDRNSSSWKTHQCLLLGGLEEFSETWPKWGLMLGGECWALTTLEPSTKGNGFGFLPTPLRSDGDGGGICRSKNGKEYNLRDWWANQGLGKSPQSRNPKFWEWVMGWPISWTDLMPVEMDKFQQWQQHSPYCMANKEAA